MSGEGVEYETGARVECVSREERSGERMECVRGEKVECESGVRVGSE